jgi:cytochrome c553
MYDIKTGARRSALALTMRPAVRDLVNEDFVDIAAYLGSRK